MQKAQSKETLNLSSKLESLNGVGPARALSLKGANLNTVSDLLDYFPRRYIDYSNLILIKNLKPGLITIKGYITSIKGRWAKGRAIHLTEAVIEDEFGSKMPVVWFNQPFRQTYFKKDQQYYFSGDFKAEAPRLNLTNPSVEPVKELEQTNTSRIVSIYPETANLSSVFIRSLIPQLKGLVKTIPESLPKEVIQEFNLIPKSEAIWQIHRPSSMQELSLAKRRLAFEELLALQLAVQKNKDQIQKLKAPKLKFNLKNTKKLTSSLKFRLTDDQRRSAWQILQDLEKEEPMNRMLMGDVGSGKTVVAAIAALQSIQAKSQVAILAPTEVLAKQHYQTFQELLSLTKTPKKITGEGSDLQIQLLTSSLKPKQKREVLNKIEDGSAKLIIGTHAIIQESVKFKNLSLVIVDEQHRFGVHQRKQLQKRIGKGKFPHLLTMTATPIPRSLALVLYGELDQSIIKQKPVGRAKIHTEVVPEVSKQKIYTKLKEELTAGHAAIFICPAITDSITSKRVSVEKVYQDLNKKAWLKKYGIGLLHGKLKSEEKEQVMQDFASGKINTLVSTTVIEVGIDVPRATVMVIEGAEFFGLAQLHQLRGRVGRSELQSYCYLSLAGKDSIPARLRYFVQSSDGFELAQYDLELRGPGQIYGKLQSGALDLRLVDITDLSLINSTKKAAKEILNKKLALSKELRASISNHQDLEYLN